MRSSSARIGLIAAVAAVIVIAGAGGLIHSQGKQPRLVLVDLAGHETPVGSLPASTFALRVAPDGKRFTYDANGIWVADLSNVKAARRIADGNFPMWSGNGEQVVYTVGPDGDQSLYMKRADGSGTAELISPGRAPESWSNAIQTMSFIALDRYYSIRTYSLKDKQTTTLIDTPGVSHHSSKFSPDGKWIAYSSDETGRLEVYVCPFPMTGAKFRVSTEGGGHALWSPDGKKIYFDNGGQLFASTVRTAPAFSAGPPVALPVKGFIQGPLRRQYDMLPDGKQFLMLFP